MPKDAALPKIEATRGYGGQIIYFDRYTDDREELAQQMIKENFKVLVDPNGHRDIIAGQGTTAKELIEQAGGELDHLFCCVGGGGLISGCSLITKKMNPGCKIWGVETEQGNRAQQSFAKGEVVKIPTPITIADGSQTRFLADFAFKIM